jgi:hypothetical protein
MIFDRLANNNKIIWNFNYHQSYRRTYLLKKNIFKILHNYLKIHCQKEIPPHIFNYGREMLTKIERDLLLIKKQIDSYSLRLDEAIFLISAKFIQNTFNHQIYE